MILALSKLRFSYRFYLWLGVAAVVSVVLGEWLLHFHPAGPEGEIEMLLNAPLERMKVGHFVAIAGVPLYFAGYYGLLKLFRGSQELYAKCLFVSGILSFTYGGIWLSTRYLGALILQKTAGTPQYSYFFDQYEGHYQILVWVLRLLVALVSLFYVLCILNNRIGLPKWLVALNPIFMLGLVISTLFWLERIGVHIAPIAMNTTHFVFFLVLLWTSRGVEVT